MAQYQLERVTIGTDEIRGLSSATFERGVQSQLIGEAGLLTGQTVVVPREAPMLRFVTREIHQLAALANWPTNDFPVISVESNPLVLYLRAIGEGTTRSSSGALTLTVNKGIIVPETLETADGVLALTLAVYPAYDGTNAPVVVGTGASLPADSPAARRLFTAYAVMNGATAMHRIASWSLDFGLSVERPSTSAYYLPDAVVTRFAPSATFQTADIANALTAANFATAGAATGGLKFVCGELDPASMGFDANGVAFTMRNGSPNSRFFIQTVEAQSGLAMATLQAIAVGAADRSAPPLTYETGVALPSESQSVLAYKLANMSFGGSSYPLESLSIDFAVGASGRGPASLPWPLEIMSLQRSPTFTVQVDDRDDAIALDPGTHETGIDFDFRAVDTVGVPLGDTDLNHLTLTIASAFLQSQSIESSHGAYATTELQGMCKADASGSVLTIATGAL